MAALELSNSDKLANPNLDTIPGLISPLYSVKHLTFSHLGCLNPGDICSLPLSRRQRLVRRRFLRVGMANIR